MQFELFQFKQLLVQKVMDPHRFYVWLDLVRSEGSPDYEKKTAIYELESKESGNASSRPRRKKSSRP